MPCVVRSYVPAGTPRWRRMESRSPGATRPRPLVRMTTDSGDSNQALAKAHAASSLRDRRMIFHTDRVLALSSKSIR